jgi:hypothetical protein
MDDKWSFMSLNYHPSQCNDMWCITVLLQYPMLVSLAISLVEKTMSSAFLIRLWECYVFACHTFLLFSVPNAGASQ